jgi:hypothetical protein
MSRFAHCEKCDHLTLKTRLHWVQVRPRSFSGPAEYQDWCEVCCESSGCEWGDDDGREYGHPGDARAGRE